ncbi:hypothetical protein CA233_21045 [Sphingomonas sp. ABOLD]|uniref:Uncharacterized protein n=1 Tax=Sphingomonas trueperi TaxID=53317 RepID=A0A7X5XZB3_9SPHN|nr:hypothetical protein [Sphingomonas sp. ABOLD]NJB96890.1 hypothetical protein [Sphingomonas trueperi]RSV39498.1 hypothetical protein CA233_21045 [Sphingomonas sp. ABOLD]
MELIFVKRAGKFDELTVVREDGVSETISCPKQGIIPHDMAHYAVESVLAHRGFLSLVQDGLRADFTAQGGDSEAAIERLVETFQAEMWGGRVPVTDLIATYEHACEARGHSVAPISAEDVEAIRDRLDDLSRRWSALALNEELKLEF